jgi:hypothetical protein
MRYAADGSILCTLAATAPSHGTVGRFSSEGHLRIDTDTGDTPEAPDGAQRVVVSDDELTPPDGTGVYAPTGAWRCTTSGSTNYDHPGVYAKDGSFKITVV